MAKTNIKRLSRYMLDRVDKNNFIEVEKVHRYIRIIEYLSDLELDIDVYGLTTITVNGSQEFKKANPSIDIWIKLNKELAKLEESINFKDDEKHPGVTKSNVIDARERMLGNG